MKKRKIELLVMVLIVSMVGFNFGCGSPQPSPGKKGTRFFELRIYTTHPGKLTDLHKRFREHTNRLFLKHGMEPLGYWSPTHEPEAQNTLIYILAYASREVREKSWEAFISDPEWQKVYQDSRKGGPIVEKVENRFMAPTDYSPIH